ncbi:hypothetical protein AB0J97_04230, partial [Nonomuraea sp. NPDC049607]
HLPPGKRSQGSWEAIFRASTQFQVRPTREHPNGEARQEFSIVLTAQPVSGEPMPSDESREVCWVPREQVTQLQMDRSMRMRIKHYLAGTALPHIG